MVSILFLGCTKEDGQDIEDDDFSAYYGGTPFKGTASGIRLQDDQDNYTWEGTGRVALIESSLDSVSLVFMADFGNEGEINLKMRGKTEGSAFRLETEDPSNFFRVIDGKITGSTENHLQKMFFEGSMEKEQVNMAVEVQFKEAEGAFPKGSRLRLRFNTSRNITDNDNGSGCQMRLVPIWSPNGMTMGMVPDC
ncbi:hypothetical protein C5745_04295 [Sphingobacterium haloxyli]|uniref:Uncharacterized protein n=2 Tax=Sphingobacterium haloxyli TaxID=2100533 RepID=A0A2S9J6N6_9SPHI|nr:hypothetical protein C5745_04295 [Sphingobacterium haloxyli]